MIGIVTDLGLAGVLSFTVTAVDADATVIPVIRRVVETLSRFMSWALAILPGDAAIAYGGVPPVTITLCIPPAATVTAVGTAVSCGVEGEGDGAVGESL